MQKEKPQSVISVVNATTEIVLQEPVVQSVGVLVMTEIVQMQEHNGTKNKRLPTVISDFQVVHNCSCPYPCTCSNPPLSILDLNIQIQVQYQSLKSDNESTTWITDPVLNLKLIKFRINVVMPCQAYQSSHIRINSLYSDNPVSKYE